MLAATMCMHLWVCACSCVCDDRYVQEYPATRHCCSQPKLHRATTSEAGGERCNLNSTSIWTLPLQLAATLNLQHMC